MEELLRMKGLSVVERKSLNFSSPKVWVFDFCNRSAKFDFAMCYGKILLVGAITFLIVTSYNYTLPNRFTLVETKDGAYYMKMNNSTGQTYWVQTKNTTDQNVF